ncbi:MAG: hypothetical protein RR135_05400 [Oscillospiraceae bacterium]
MEEEQSRAAAVAGQLLQIARLELSCPLEGQRSLVLGDGPTAQTLGRLLQDRDSSVVCCSPLNLPKEGAFTLLFLFDQPTDEVLDRLTAPGALVVDLGLASGGGWVTHDPASHFRRVRVLRLAQHIPNEGIKTVGSSDAGMSL